MTNLLGLFILVVALVALVLAIYATVTAREMNHRQSRTENEIHEELRELREAARRSPESMATLGLIDRLEHRMNITQQELEAVTIDLRDEKRITESLSNDFDEAIQYIATLNMHFYNIKQTPPPMPETLEIRMARKRR